MAGSGLFACTKCHSRHRFEDLSKEEQLCKECRRKYPSISCNFCQLEYHILQKIDGVNVCPKCSHNYKTYGKPSSCRYCNVKAAFKDKCCARCASSEKKYGAPVKCQGCSLSCAFIKSKDSQAKVNGKTLCLHCTLKFKKDRHQTKKQQLKEQKYQKKKDTTNPALAPLKAENITKSLYKTAGADSLETRHSTVAKVENNNSLEPTFGDHMTEITSLREQIIQLNKTIAQKEKIILDKDKKINELQADKWEREKLLRAKNQNQSKEYLARIETLQIENSNLRKQLRELSKVKKTPKLEKVASRIRLEPHKINLTPTSGRSPDSRKEATTATEESGTEPEVNEQSENDVKKEEEKDKSESESEEESSATKGDSKLMKSFDEAQAGEIKKLLEDDEDDDSGDVDVKSEEEEEEEEGGQNDDDVKKRKKSRHRKRKNRVEDDDDEEDEDEIEERKEQKKRKKAKKSKAIISDHEDDSDQESGKETPVVKSGDDGSNDEPESPEMEIDDVVAEKDEKEFDDDISSDSSSSDEE